MCWTFISTLFLDILYFDSLEVFTINSSILKSFLILRKDLTSSDCLYCRFTLYTERGPKKNIFCKTPFNLLQTSKLPSLRVVVIKGLKVLMSNQHLPLHEHMSFMCVLIVYFSIR